MVMARLHIICGNCGCNDDWELRIERDGDDVTDDVERYEDAVSMVCGNCSTIHDLKDNAKVVSLIHE
jgi:hypothetical protein